MVENGPDNLVLQLLGEIRDDVSTIKEDMHSLIVRMTSLEENMAGMDRRIDRFEAGASEGKSTVVAESVVALQTRLDSIASKLSVGHAKLALIKWIVSGIGFGMIALVIKSFLL